MSLRHYLKLVRYYVTKALRSIVKIFPLSGEGLSELVLLEDSKFGRYEDRLLKLRDVKMSVCQASISNMSLNNLAKLSINENRLPSCPRCLCSSEPSSPTPHPVLRTTFSHAGEKEKIDAFSFYFSQKRKCAFTLAEVLITLGIIGVVAAMTISTLIHKYKMHVLEAQFKKAYSVVQNVNSMLKYNDIEPYVDYQLGVSQREEAAAIKQVEDFAKYTKGSRICDGHYYTCTLGKRWPEESKRYKTLDGSNNVHIDPDAYTTKIILLADGSTVWVGGTRWAKNRYYYDINGTAKGPNKLGYDLHVFVLNNKGIITTEENKKQCSFGESAVSDSYFGYGCTQYAITNTNPDDETKNYWQGFLK